MFNDMHHLIYLTLSIGVTVLVATLLRRNGRAMLAEAFGGNEAVASAANQLFTVTFYLVNFGVIALALRIGKRPADGLQMVEHLSTKLGVVLLFLGILHSLKVRRIAGLRRRALEQRKES